MLILGAIGGIIPDLLRIMKNPNLIKQYKGLKLLSPTIQIILGVFGVWLFSGYLNQPGMPPKVLATTIGFAAPELITRILGVGSSLLNQTQLPPANPELNPTSRGLTPQKNLTLMEWWRI